MAQHPPRSLRALLLPQLSPSQRPHRQLAASTMLLPGPWRPRRQLRHRAWPVLPLNSRYCHHRLACAFAGAGSECMLSPLLSRVAESCSVSLASPQRLPGCPGRHSAKLTPICCSSCSESIDPITLPDSDICMFQGVKPAAAAPPTQAAAVPPTQQNSASPPAQPQGAANAPAQGVRPANANQPNQPNGAAGAAVAQPNNNNNLVLPNGQKAGAPVIASSHHQCSPAGC